MPDEITGSIVDAFIASEPPVSRIADQAESDTLFGDSSDEETFEGTSGGSSAPTPPQSGEIFDAAIHAVDASGNPVRKSDGTYKRKPGRKKGQSVSVNRVGENGGAAGVQPPNEDVARAAAYQTVSAIFLIGSIIGGDEFAPIVNKEMGYNEQQVLVDAWTAFYLQTDMKAIPPWVGVTIATGSYIAIRMTMPKTQTRMQKFWGWLMEKFTGEPAPKEEKK